MHFFALKLKSENLEKKKKQEAKSSTVDQTLVSRVT